jgi:hypothetical protein
MRPSKAEIVIYPSKVRLFTLLLLDVVFGLVAALLVFLWWTGEIRTVLALVFGTLGVLGALFAGPYLAFRLVVRRPALVIGPEGILDDSSILRAGFMRWDEIEGIMPKDVHDLLARQSSVKRCLMRANMGLGASPINVPQSVLGIKVADLASQLANVYGARLPASPSKG